MHVWYCLYTIFSFTPFFEKPGNRNRSQGRMRPSDPFASSFPGFSFSSSFGFGNGFGSDPFGSNRYRKCFPDFWHHCNFTSRKFSGQKRINTIFLLFSSNQCYLSVTLDPYLSTCTFYSWCVPFLICNIYFFWFLTVSFTSFQSFSHGGGGGGSRGGKSLDFSFNNTVNSLLMDTFIRWTPL